MSPRSPRCCALLAAAGLLIAPPARGQDAPSAGPAQPPPTADATAVLTDPNPFAPARPPTPWFVDGETAVLFTTAVHYNDHVAAVEERNPVFISPRVYVGRRLTEAGAAVRFTYRNLTQVSQLREDFGDGWSADQSFTLNWFDLDVVSREFAPTPWWRLQTEGGVRFVYGRVGFSSRGPYSRSESSESYFGVGPHLGLTSHWLLGRSGWAVYGRTDLAATFGTARTRYDYAPLDPDPMGWDATRSDAASAGQWQFDLGLQLGLAKRGEWAGRAVGLVVGVQADVVSRGNLGGGEFGMSGFANVGPFLRCEVGF